MRILSLLVMPFLLALNAGQNEVLVAPEQEDPDTLIGTHFLDVREADPDGTVHSLSDYAGKGQWVLVDFWASWCGPCRAEMPNVVAAYKKYHKKGFEIVGFSFDFNRDNWVKAIESLEMPWIHLSDLQGWESLAGQVYDIHAIPDNILIDPEGTIVARDLRGPQLEEYLSAIFKPAQNEKLSRILNQIRESRER